MNEVLHPQEQARTDSSTDLQIWNNAAFDSGDSEDSPIVTDFSAPNLSRSILSDSSVKENLTPSLVEMPHPAKSPTQTRPLRSNPVLVNSQPEQPHAATKTALTAMKTPATKKKATVSFSTTSSLESQEDRGKELFPLSSCEDRKNIDSEIQEIEKEIGRLSSRLETLRLERAKTTAKSPAPEKRGRFVPAKFMEPKRNTDFFESLSKIEDSINAAGSKLKTPQRGGRGVSMAPAEIARGVASLAAAGAGRRGISLGPAEIFSATKMRQLGKHHHQGMITPVYQSQSRKKSCFWKLQEVDELKVIKERGKSFSLSPKSRKTTASKFQVASKQAATTVGPAKKLVKKEDSLISSIQPKKLFKEGEKTAPAAGKKPIKCGRVVPSRYNQTNAKAGGRDSSSVQGSARKRSLPDNEKEESKACEKKRISLSGLKSQGGGMEPVGEKRVKKRWEIPSQVVMAGSDTVSVTPVSVTKLLEKVPKIIAARCGSESPRDSGPAKRVSELVGRKSYFDDEGDEDREEFTDPSLCQALSYEVGEEEEEEDKCEKKYLRIKTLCRIDESPRDSGAAKRVSELVGRKSYFAEEDVDQEEENYARQALNFAEEGEER